MTSEREMGYLEQAIALAAKAHSGQVDKAGKPYILHPLRVMLAVSDAAKVCAVLHDVVEDCPGYDLRMLNRSGFSSDVVAAVEALTRRDWEEYEDYLDRVMGNPLALEVKVADLRDNLDASRGAPRHARREARYRLALAKLVARR